MDFQAACSVYIRFQGVNGYTGTNDILEHTAGRGRFPRPLQQDRNPKALKNQYMRHQRGDGMR